MNQPIKSWKQLRIEQFSVPEVYKVHDINLILQSETATCSKANVLRHFQM